jgi:hypothetical protein
MLPLGEVVFLPSLPARVVKMNAVVGREVTQPLLTLATGDVLAAGTLPGTDPQGVAAGLPAEIGVGAKNETFHGTIRAVGPDAAAVLAGGESATTSSATGSGTAANAGSGVAQQPGFAVIVAADPPLDPRLVGQEVRLRVVVSSSQQPVLVVPVAAVSATADGTVTVTVVDAAGGQRAVSVTVGASGDGYVEVTPVDATLRPGDRVVVGTQ